MAQHWILLRGLTRESAHWGRFPELLGRALADATVHLLDLPGNGARCAEDSPDTVAGMVQACRASLRERDIRAPVHLLALSLGAMVATQWALSAPADIASAVLVNTSLRPFSPVHHRLRPGQWGRLLQLLGPGIDPLRVEKLVWRMTSQRPVMDETELAAWADARRQRPVRRINALRQLLAAVRFRAPLAPPNVPLLLLASDGDRLVNPACSLALAQAWNLPLHRHPWAGHDLPLDDPDWLAHQVRAWGDARIGVQDLSQNTTR